MSGIVQCLNGPVTVGDMVRMVMPAPCCGTRVHIGTEFRVLRVLHGKAKCSECGQIYSGALCEEHQRKGSPSAICIRIDPPALPESIDTEREVTA